LDGVIGLVIGGFEFAFGSMMWIGLMVEAAVGQRAAETFVEDQEEECHLRAFGCETVGIA